MLWEARETQTVTFDDKTYDVLSISPTFTAPLGVWPFSTEVYWGKGVGNGAFTVDYRDTSNKFWTIVAEHRPIAIMSFSRWKFDKDWMLDAWATNWERCAWITRLSYVPTGDTKQEQQTWEFPYVGGSTDDPAPPSEGHAPKEPFPPDPTKPAAPIPITPPYEPGTQPPLPPPPPAATRRNSNLPMDAIIDAINNAEPPLDMTAKKNDVEGPGRFVSNFLAYHVVWYREWWNAQAESEGAKCLKSGHTHVGGQITVEEAEKAAKIQLEQLFKVLPETS